MPHKDPSIWNSILKAISEYPELIAAITAIARIMYFRRVRKVTRILLEAFLCMTLTLCASRIIDYFNLPEKADIAIAVLIGFIGVETIREILIKLLNKQTEERPHHGHDYNDEDDYL